MLGNRTQSLISDSYDDGKHWEVFLQTLFNNEQIKVTGLQEETVEVECMMEEAKRAIEIFLASPHAIKTSIIHSVFESGLPVVVENTYARDVAYLISEDMSPKELIERVLDESFLEPLGIDWSKFECDALSKTWISTQEFPNKQRKLRAISSYQLVQSALSNPQFNEILISDTSEKIKEESLEGFVSKDISRLFRIEESELSFKITMDVPAYNAYMKVKHLLSSHASTGNQYSQDSKLIFNKSALIQYFNGIFENGIIYKREQDGELRPIVALSSSMNSTSFKSTKEPNIIILMDISGSMKHCFEAYKENIISMSKGVREKYQESVIRVHTFSSSVDTDGIIIPSARDCERYTSEQEKYVAALGAISGFKADGGTALYFAIKTALSSLVVSGNDIILLFTDGYESANYTHAADGILQDLREERKRNPQFSMFAFGAGNYDKQFFENLSKTTGVIIENLGTNFNELSLIKYMNTLGKAKTLVEFLSSTGILAALQVVPDQPMVSRQSFNAAEVSRVGTYSQSGREEKSVSFNGI